MRGTIGSSVPALKHGFCRYLPLRREPRTWRRIFSAGSNIGSGVDTTWPLAGFGFTASRAGPKAASFAAVEPARQLCTGPT
jgi:hypothetical protein